MKKHDILYIGILLSAAACGPRTPQILTGDLLFQAAGQAQMSEAIAAATGEAGALNFAHVAIAVACEKGDSVLEATTRGGVRMRALAEFLEGSERIGGKPAVVAMRLKDTTGVAAAVKRARRSLGLPYDSSFLPGNGKFYCSELVFEHYLRRDGTPLFTARPMNFRASDGSMPAFWTELFERQGEPIPEGVPGTNPNDMAREACLTEVGRWF